MRRLSGTDSLFLAMETPAWHQHVGGLTVLTPGSRGLTYEDIIRNTEERIGYAPKFRWKLRSTPLGLDRPVWVDDPDFDVRRHVRRVAVPSPGGAREVGELCGQLLSTQLDRGRPLWEMWVIEGLAGGRTGVLMKYHHCLLDGMAGASLATALLDLDPDATGPLVPLPSEEESTAGDLHSWNIVGGIASRTLKSPFTYARYATALAGKGVTMANRFIRDEGSRAILTGPKTSLNAAIGPRRQLAFAAVSMADIVAIKRAHDVKVNDVVLALCSSALRDYLISRDELPETSLNSGVPISTREVGDTTHDNQITSMFVSLATDVEDPIERLLAINASTQSAKGMAEAMSARQIQSLGEVAAPLILGNAIKAMYRTGAMSRNPLTLNTLVSNVPGPPIDLYMSGSKVTGIFPSSVIMEGMGTNFTVMSNQDRMDFGLHVDPDLCPDPWSIAEGITRAAAELLAASGLGEPTPVDDPFSPLASEPAAAGATGATAGAGKTGTTTRKRKSADV